MTNGINAVADGVRVPLDFSDGPSRTPLVRLIELEEASNPVKRIYQDIQAFYQTACVLNVFKVLAHDEAIYMTIGPRCALCSQSAILIA